MLFSFSCSVLRFFLTVSGMGQGSGRKVTSLTGKSPQPGMCTEDWAFRAVPLT